MRIIQFAMRSLPHHPKQCYCCYVESPGKSSDTTSQQFLDPIPRSQTTSRPWMTLVTWIKAVAGGSSQASQRYTPTSSSTTSTPLSNSQAAGGTNTNPSATDNSNAPTQVSDQPATDSSSASPDPSNRVLFAVQGSRWSLEVEQINITRLLNDPMFFRELKARYRKHRNWIKWLISPFRFRFCRFVKVPFYSYICKAIKA